ncbi:hypothetical protein BDZ90DRAFT_34402 [Jaminaea rosea]|uniref:Uncharacterized protein n=1 Tax=Jaminaea rosea TaxID=1569628 RepID=A0A316V0R9_9BASI|nr:hypothetical protein BDZ90DRAFT_34402 [Jaminaea rosea]PWN31072.1 hypothetical protein BDZ90DRAFT_34402 [Jaminaea rosea]
MLSKSKHSPSPPTRAQHTRSAHAQHLQSPALASTSARRRLICQQEQRQGQRDGLCSNLASLHPLLATRPRAPHRTISHCCRSSSTSLDLYHTVHLSVSDRSVPGLTAPCWYRISTRCRRLSTPSLPRLESATSSKSSNGLRTGLCTDLRTDLRTGRVRPGEARLGTRASPYRTSFLFHGLVLPRAARTSKSVATPSFQASHQAPSVHQLVPAALSYRLPHRAQHLIRGFIASPSSPRRTTLVASVGAGQAVLASVKVTLLAKGTPVFGHYSESVRDTAPTPTPRCLASRLPALCAITQKARLNGSSPRCVSQVSTVDTFDARRLLHGDGLVINDRAETYCDIDTLIRSSRRVIKSSPLTTWSSTTCSRPPTRKPLVASTPPCIVGTHPHALSLQPESRHVINDG